MSRPVPLIACLLLAASARAAPEPHLEKVACWFEVPAGRQATCARMHVPENRARGDTRLIDFPVVVLHSGEAERAPDPVVILGGGGPGSAVGLEAERIGQWWDFMDGRVLEGGRDLVVADQRGAGLARPSLACPEVADSSLEMLTRDASPEEETAEARKAALRCRARLVAAGVDLAAYDSAAGAADFEDLRRALGVERWNLQGTSYGARLALTLMRDFPAGVRSAVLDSPEIPEALFYSEGAASAHRAFHALFTACAADAACAERVPHLDRLLAELVARLDREPVTLKLAHPETLAPWPVVLNGGRLIEALFLALYDPEQIPGLPVAIAAAHKGAYDLLMPYVRGLLETSADSGWSDGLYLSVQCREEMPFDDPERALAAVEPYPYLRSFHRLWVRTEAAVCGAWGAGTAGAVESRTVRSAIPTLLLAGWHDPVTPPEWALWAHRQLRNSFFVEFPGASHDVLSSEPCAAALAEAFIERPRRDPTDLACLSESALPAFRLRP